MIEPLLPSSAQRHVIMRPEQRIRFGMPRPLESEPSDPEIENFGNVAPRSLEKFSGSIAMHYARVGRPTSADTTGRAISGSRSSEPFAPRVPRPRPGVLLTR